MADSVTIAYLHPEDIAYSFHHSLMELLAFDFGGKQRVVRGGVIGMQPGTNELVAARNKVTEQFLAGPGEWLLWIDSDMGFEPSMLEDLLAVADPDDRPVVGALCFGYKDVGPDGCGGQIRRAFPTVFDFVTEDGESGFRPRYDYEPGTVARVDATGSAAVLIHRQVLVDIAAANNGKPYDRIQASPKMLLGEDVSFCVRAVAAGHSIWVHTGVRTTHKKNLWVSEAAYFEALGVPPATDEVAVIVPVLHRPANAAPFMASLRASTGLATVYAVCDPDDTDTAAAWKAAGATVITSTDGSGFAVKVNQGYRETSEPWIFMCGDDVTFRRGWLDHAQWIGARAHVVGTNDLANGRVMAGIHATHMLIRRSYVDEVGASWAGPGVVAHEYGHWYVDDEIVTAAKQRGVWSMALGAIVEHHHPTFDPNVPMDDTYRKGQASAEQDRRIFKKRLAQNGGPK